MAVSYEIKKNLGSWETKSGWTTEINIISWNGNEPKIDIRNWSPDHQKMGKGITLTDEEAEKLVEILKARIAERK